MVECKDECSKSKPISTIYSNTTQKTIAQILHFSGGFSVAPMKRSAARPVFSLLLLAVVAATFGCRVAIRTGFGSVYPDPVYFWGKTSSPENDAVPVDFPLFNSTLLKLAEVEPGEGKLKQEISQLLEGNFGNPARLRTFATWRRFFNSGDIRARTSRGVPVSLRSPAFRRIWVDFRRTLSNWSSKKRFQPNILEELVETVKSPIDAHYSSMSNSEHVKKKKYSSCAVVGNSGILLTQELGDLIDSHEAVIRLNNARISSYQRHVGAKTTISFVNSNILHLCARREDCFCHPYGPNIPIVMYMCQPLQFLDYVVCNLTHKSPLMVTDPRFDVLCTRIVKYYSLKRFALGVKDGENKTFEKWNSSHDGSMFHYSSGMQAVMLALGVCDRVSLFGFGKSNTTKHHYHTNQKAELNLHDYEAEYEFYRDLVKKPNVIPFIPRGFKFPPVVIHR